MAFAIHALLHRYTKAGLAKPAQEDQPGPSVHCAEVYSPVANLVEADRMPISRDDSNLEGFWKSTMWIAVFCYWSAALHCKMDGWPVHGVGGGGGYTTHGSCREFLGVTHALYGCFSSSTTPCAAGLTPMPTSRSLTRSNSAELTSTSKSQRVLFAQSALAVRWRSGLEAGMFKSLLQHGFNSVAR